MRPRLMFAAVIATAIAACTTGAPPPTASEPAVPASGSAARATPVTTGTPRPTATTAASAEPSLGVSCGGDDLLWELLPPPAQAYALAWVSLEQSERLARLEEGMAADASYAEPTRVGRVSGLLAIAEHIGAFQRGHERQFFRVRAWAPMDAHNDYVRVRWMLCHRDGTITLQGEDILVLEESGLVGEATRFFGP